MTADGTAAGSFRDPHGFVFHREGTIHRQVNRVHQPHYDHMMQSGLYADLTERRLLVPHEEVAIPAAAPDLCYRTLRPEPVPFISYPYEWCFSQIADAALATLAIQKRALHAGMTLRDASTYNIQFFRGRPILIDTLSFAIYREGAPWVAYRQFCQHFLGPLAVMSYGDIRMRSLYRSFIDGLPLDLTVRLLPARARLRLPLLFHIHLHARAQKRYAYRNEPAPARSLSRRALLNLIAHLESAVRCLTWKPGGTEWAEYYQDTNYTPAGLDHKQAVVRAFLERLRPRTVWDLGANTGLFSRIAAEAGALTIALDTDPAAVETNYRTCIRDNETHLLPLIMDLSNPSPALGWAHEERMSLRDRGPADAVLALALVHHLAISNNVPLAAVAGFLRSISRAAIVEFVPKSDSQVQRLLMNREDVFSDYTQPEFEKAFAPFFTIDATEAIKDSERTLYLMTAR